MPKAALVTGGAKRIGKVLAMDLARRGYDVALHYNQSVLDARTTADEIMAMGRRCELFRGDLADAAFVRRLVPQVLDAMPGLSLLINNASIFERAKLAETDEPLLDRNLAINLRAPVVLAQAFAARGAPGHIINLLDTKIARPGVNYFAYTLCKKALADFTRMAACELAPDIRVNGVCPGMTLAPEGKRAGYLDWLSGAVPLRRPGGPEQIAAAVGFLLDNDYITGQILYIDGGEHLGDDITPPPPPAV
jgi:NAD(P)-dependent dehydrogenase (short-subunit alcohol dehydrogenase family)